MGITLLIIEISCNQENVRELILSSYLQKTEFKYSAIAKKAGASIRTVKWVISCYRKCLLTIRKKGLVRKTDNDKKSVKKVKDLFERNPNTSVRDVAVRAGTLKDTVK